MPQNNQAFTLIELLVVVLIIGILATVALPQYQLAVTKARFVQLQTAGDAFIKAYKIYYLANGQNPTTLDQLDMLPFNGTFNETKTAISNEKMSCYFNGENEFACCQSKVPYWLYFFPTSIAQENQDKRICRAYTDIQKKICINAGGILKRENSTYTDYYLP